MTAEERRQAIRNEKKAQLLQLEQALDRTMLEFKTILGRGGDTSVIHAHRCDIEEAIDGLRPT